MVDLALIFARRSRAQRRKIILVARRGPLEAKFEEKNLRTVQIDLDRKTFKMNYKELGHKLLRSVRTLRKYLNKFSMSDKIPRRAHCSTALELSISICNLPGTKWKH